jgi:hypothetical protein
MSSKMQIVKVCKSCGREFVARTTVTDCCSDPCAKRYYKEKKRLEKMAEASLKTEIREKPEAFITEDRIKAIQAKEFLNLKEAALLLNVSPLTLRRWVLYGKLVSDENTIVINLGRQEGARTHVGHKASSSGDTVTSSTHWFTGTKKFCDGQGGWYYKVTIVGDKITLRLYADKDNTYQKDKVNLKETVVGVIRNGKIITKDPPQYLTNRFKFESGVLYEVNDEGGYNEYQECKP